MGLSQVYGFVQQSKGDLTIESTPGVITKISMYLPAVVGSVNSEDEKQRSFAKVLIVDDQPDVLEMAAGLFKSLGYEVFTARDGLQAVDILQQTPSMEVLFSDLVMPGMNGIELAQRAQEMIPLIRILLTSGFAEPGVLTDHDKLEQFQFVSKPYRVTDVIKKLQAA